MRTTLNLPDELMRSVKVRAAQTDRTLTETVTDLLREGLGAPERSQAAERVKLPLVRSGVVGKSKDFTPERISEVLLHGEVEGALGQNGQ